MSQTHTEKPLVYSCSGCSNVAQLANRVAVSMDRQGTAEMSCIAGVGGNVKSLVRVAKSGRPILGIDGCKLACVQASLRQHNVQPTWHLELSELGLRKRKGEDCSQQDHDRVLDVAIRLVETTVNPQY
jgi:uncharacterized metal-binding protein